VIASTNNQKDFLSAVSNANADSHVGYTAPGVIPANGLAFFNAGMSLSLGLGPGASLSNGINFPKNEIPPIGVGVQTGFTLGMSGRALKLPLPLDPARTMYTLSFSSMDLSSIIGKGVSLKMTQVSAGMMYQLFTPTSWTPLFRYNGIQLSGGLSYSKFDASYSTPFNISQADGSGDTMNWASTLAIGISSSVFSLAPQATTGVRMLGLVNVYTGLGLDFSFGSSSITGGSDGTLTATNSGSKVYDSTTTVGGGGESAAPTFVKLRYLAGLEFDVGPTGIYIQGQASTSSVYGLGVGAHVSF
jgi:hypothetical protein